VDEITREYPTATIYTEYLDAIRFPEKLLDLEAVSRRMAEKYRSISLDAAIISDNKGLAWARSGPAILENLAGVVLCGLNNLQPADLEDLGRVTAVAEHPSFAETFALMRSWFPQTRRILVLGEPSETFFGNRGLFAADIASSAFPVTVDYHMNPEMDSIRQVLQRLTEQDVVFLMCYPQERKGVPLSIPEATRQLAQASSRPIFSGWDFWMGHGIIGGKMVSATCQGTLAGEKTLLLLKGVPARDIPVSYESPNRYVVDYEQLTRFGVHERLIPSAAWVINRPETWFSRNRQMVLLVFAVLLSLCCGLGLALVSALRRVRAEEALRLSQERLDLVMNSVNDGLWDWNLMTDEIYFSPRYYSMLGYEMMAFPGRYESWRDLIHPDDVGRAEEAVKRHIQGARERLHLELRMRMASGEWLWVQARGMITHRDPTGKALRMVGTHTDITGRVRDAEEKRCFERQMQQAQKLESLGVMAGGIAHDFNNLLMVIIGNLDLVLNELGERHPLFSHLSAAETASYRAADLCRQMLAYSGRGKFLIERFNVNTVLQEMVRMLGISISKKASLKLLPGHDLPCIEADATQIRQIIMNLVINASEALNDQEGSVIVTTGLQKCDQTYLASVWLPEPLPEGEYVFIEVADTGCGMTPDTLKKVFDPFFTTKFTGRGLGLAAVLGIVCGHHGAIRLDSEPGKGTTFRVLFPAISSPEKLLGKTPVASSRQVFAGRVLLVDDEASIRELGEKMLKSLGFDVVAAAHGREAVAIYTREIAAALRPFKFVILDLTMPEMDGRETCVALQALDPEVYVIISSGYSEQDVSERFAGKTIAGFIQKPYTRAGLQDVAAAVMVRGTT
jgi:PAS domain S-box-containing protein